MKHANDNGLDLEKLRGFAQELFDEWPDYLGVDGFDLQEIAVRHGLLVETTRFEPCSLEEGRCSCLAYYGDDEWKAGVTCYRKSRLLGGTA